METIFEKKQPRARFLKQIGMTLAAGIAAAAAPSLARAQGAMRPYTQYQCCPRSTCPSCAPGTGQPYFCDCPDGSYCTCLADSDCVFCAG